MANLDNIQRSMDDVSKFGPVVYHMTYAEGVEQGIIVPLGLLVYNVSASYADTWALHPELEIAVRDERVSRANAELVVATLAAMREHGLSRGRLQPTKNWCRRLQPSGGGVVMGDFALHVGYGAEGQRHARAPHVVVVVGRMRPFRGIPRNHQDAHAI